MMKKSVLAVILVAGLIGFGVAPVAQASPVRPGAKCETPGQARVVGSKFFTCTKSTKNSGPKNVWNAGSSATPMRRAYSQCKLWKTNKVYGTSIKLSEIADGGQTLAMDSVGRFTGSGPQYDDMLCALNYLKAPSYVRTQIGNTRALDGMQQARWGNVSAMWNYHPDSGASITFTTLR